MDQIAAPAPLRTVEIDVGQFLVLYEQTPDCWGMEVDWADRRTVAGKLRRALRRRGCRAALPRCRGADQLDLWLRAVNALIDQPDAFADGRAHELIDLAPGSDIYAIVLCPTCTFPAVPGLE